MCAAVGQSLYSRGRKDSRGGRAVRAAGERIKHTVLSQRSCSSVKPLTEEGALAARVQRVYETIEKNE